MKYNSKEIKQGVKIHFLNTNKFKTNLMAVTISTPVKRDNVTKNALVTSILRRGTAIRKSMNDISIELENMYGAEFDCGIEKLGDNHILKFYLESINDNYINNNSNVLEKSLEILLEIILNPLTENNGFNEEYLKQEKLNLQQLIEGRKDDKDKYAFERCVEEMYKNKNHGLYRYGYIEDLEKIENNELYNYYNQLIDTAKIDIFISGEFDENKILSYIENSEYIKKIKDREPEYIKDNPENEKRDVNKIEESMEVSQGKLVIGLKIDEQDTNNRFVSSVYNAILGGSANSKLFQNVREKESLAYTIGSRFVRQKNNIYIKCGIDLENYDKAIKLINKELEDIRNGNFTEEDIKNAKIFLESGIKMLEDEQDLTITYYIGQELSDIHMDFEEYINQINKTTKEQIVEIANKINVDTIYFLKN